MELNEQAARRVRKIISQLTGLQVESVPFIQRRENLEFAALVLRTEGDETTALEWLTEPRNPYRVTRQTPTRIFIAASA